jgi:hypothetical protein
MSEHPTIVQKNRPDTVGQPPSAEIWVSKMPSALVPFDGRPSRAILLDVTAV